MPLDDDSGAFEREFRAAVASVLPTARVECVAGTVIAVKLPVRISFAVKAAEGRRQGTPSPG